MGYNYDVVFRSLPFLDRFSRRKGTLSGAVQILGLPEYRSWSVDLYFFPVRNVTSPLPYNGSPPNNKYPKSISILGMNDPADKPLNFSSEIETGFYYLDIGVILIREIDAKLLAQFPERGPAKLLAQVEHFFPQRVPCEVLAGKETLVALNAEWPSIPIEKLGYYCTIYPSKR